MSLRGQPVLYARRPPFDPHPLAHMILAERRFRIAVPSTRRTWWEIVLGWLRDMWKRFTDATAAHVHLSPRTAVLLGDALVIVLAGLVIFIGLRLLLASVRDPRTRRSGASELFEVEEPGALYEQGRQAASRGDYTTAIVMLFQAALLRLEQLGVMNRDPSRTVNEYRRAVASRRPAIAACFDEIARVFTTALYADAPVEHSQWTAAEAAYRAFPLAGADG